MHKSVVGLKSVTESQDLAPELIFERLSNGPEALRAAARIHLFTLLFEDCKLLCAQIVNNSRVVSEMVKLLDVVQVSYDSN